MCTGIFRCRCYEDGFRCGYRVGWADRDLLNRNIFDAVSAGFERCGLSPLRCGCSGYCKCPPFEPQKRLVVDRGHDRVLYEPPQTRVQTRRVCSCGQLGGVCTCR